MCVSKRGGGLLFVDFIYNLEAKLNIESDNLNGIIFGNETLKLIGKDLQLCSIDLLFIILIHYVGFN